MKINELKIDINEYLHKQFDNIELILFYGSILYPCLFNNKSAKTLFDSKSDVDIIILSGIIKNDELCLEYELSNELQQYFKIKTINLNIRFITLLDFNINIKNFNDFVFIQALRENTNHFLWLNVPEFRQLVSKTSSNSFVKCFKKIHDEEFYIGLKSLFHSIVIPIKAICYLTNTKHDIEFINTLFDEILNDYQLMSIEDFKLKYQKIRNSEMTKFRSICAK